MLSDLTKGEADPRVRAYIVLAVSVAAISWAAPLIRFTDANPLAISFWRLLISLPFVAAIVSYRGEWQAIRGLSSRDRWIAGVAGVFLSFHFAMWIASVQFTSVAASVALVATQPVWVGILGLLFLSEGPRPRQWVGIGIAMVGATVIGYGGWLGGRNPFLGDILALGGAMAVSVYYVIGRSLRRRIGVWPYVLIVYATAAAVLLPIMTMTGVPILTGYSSTDWLVFLGLAVGPMILGHTGQNYALGYLPAHTVNLTLLGEPLGATAIAWLLPTIHEVPGREAVIGGCLILSGILLGFRRR